MPLDPLEVSHMSQMFGLEEEQVTKTKIKEQALLQKGVLVSKSLFRLSNDGDDNLCKHMHCYHATVRLLRDNSSVLPTYSRNHSCKWSDTSADSVRR